MRVGLQPQKPASVMPQDQKTIEKPETNRRHYEQVHGGYAVGMVSVNHREVGIKQPAAVRSATKAWHQESDHLNAFVSSELIISPGCKIPASKLFDLYTKWCAKHAERALTVQKFKEQLQESHDLTHSRTKGHSWWHGVQLRG